MALKKDAWPSCKHDNYRQLARKCQTETVKNVVRSAETPVNRTILKQELRQRGEL